MTSGLAFFDTVPDGRAANARHPLGDLLLIAFAALLCGAQTCVDIADFGRAKQHVLGEIVDLPHGVPSHDTFSRVFRLLDPAAFEAAFRRFMAHFAAARAQRTGDAVGRIVAIDGKSLRGAVDAARPSAPLHLVTAWAAEQRLVLGQAHAPDRSEVQAARTILGLLDLTGSLVTADALHGSRPTAATICARGGDYALVIKGNRGPLHKAAQTLLAEPDPRTGALTREIAHGRHEERRAWVVPVPGWDKTHRFPGLTAVARIDSLRRIGTTEQRQTRYIALSRCLKPDEALRVVRAQWSIENQQHWILDVVLGEDRAATRHDHTAQNMALLRRLVLSLLQQDPERLSIRRKIKLAGWRDTYLTTLIGQMR